MSRRLAPVLIATLATTALAQEPSEPLRLAAVAVGGARTSLTDGWGVLRITLANAGDAGRDARVTAAYAGEPDVQYGRDVHVPGRSTLTTFLTVGPPLHARPPQGRNLELLLYDRTGGRERLVLPPGTERVRTRTLAYRKREPTVTLLAGVNGPDPLDARFVRAFRLAAGQSPLFHGVAGDITVTSVEAFDGTDLVVVADRHLADDAPARAALGRWVESGGRLWVMLDRAGPDLVDGIEVVGRTSLTAVRLQPRAAGVESVANEFEEPVEFVRVVPGPADAVLTTVDGWPAAFVRTVGRGRILVTTLGTRAWCRPRVSADGKSPYPDVADLPVPFPPLGELALHAAPTPESTANRTADVLPLATDEIGYAVIGLGPAGLVFGGFLLALLAAGVGLRWTRRPELVGWLGPAAAVVAAGAFVGLGESSRREVPPTVAIAQVIEVVPGARELPVAGQLALYRPDAGPAAVASHGGGRLELDAAGLSGQTRRLVQTDLATWHWENLALPAGLRTGPFRFTARIEEPPSAVARFGPSGVEGRLRAGPFRNLSDAILRTATGRTLAARFAADGSFTAAGESPAVLSDRQQRRQAVYRNLPAGGDGRDALLAWADALDSPFTFGEGVRTVGSALVTFPLEFERPPPDTQLTVPGGFVTVARLQDGRATRPALQGQAAGATMRLRFQVPPSVWPLRVERATLSATVDAPGRRFAVTAGGREVFASNGPSGTMRLDIDDAALLEADDRGGLHLTIAVGDAAGRGKLAWAITAMELEVTGRILEP